MIDDGRLYVSLAVVGLAAGAMIHSGSRSVASRSRVVLLSCTKSKDPRARREAISVRDLYAPSALFRGGVAWAERRRLPWAVLSAKHGLLLPDDRITSYDETLAGAPKSVRVAWADKVIRQLEERGWLDGSIFFEIHAGEAYAHPLTDLLDRHGISFDLPLSGLTLGQRLSLYRTDRS